MLGPNNLLVKCTKCGAWPMAVGSQGTSSHGARSASDVRSEEDGRLRHAGASQINAYGGLMLLERVGLPAKAC
jgi:hypothetical protein